jgi:hypothetical protein
MRALPLRPWQRPPQLQHGHHDNVFGDAEATGALLARLAAARDWEARPTSDAWQHPGSSAPVGIPFDWTDDAAVAYLNLLDRILQDRVITTAEVRRLRQFAADWGIGALEAACLHRGYLAIALERACADATVNPAELRDIQALAGLLGIPFEVRRRVARGGGGARLAVPIEVDPVASGPPPWSVTGEVVGR